MVVSIPRHEGIAQVDKTGVLIPVEYQNWRCRCRSGGSEENSDDGFSRAYTRGMMSCDEDLGLNKRRPN
jgi:hypothetical protein